MPDEVMVVTMKLEAWVPTSVTVPVEGTEQLNDEGKPIVGSERHMRFRRGQTYKVPIDLGKSLVEGNAGRGKVAFAGGKMIRDQMFFEGVPESDSMNPSAMVGQIKQLQVQLAQLQNTAGVVPSDVVDEVEAEPGIPLEDEPDSDEFSILDGKYQVSITDGRILCPICNAWTTRPAQPGYDTRRAIEQHIRMAHKDEIG